MKFNTMISWLGSGLLSFLALNGANLSAQTTRMLAEPAVSDSHIAFAYDLDLWIADRNGQWRRDWCHQR